MSDNPTKDESMDTDSADRSISEPANPDTSVSTRSRATRAVKSGRIEKAKRAPKRKSKEIKLPLVRTIERYFAARIDSDVQMRTPTQENKQPGPAQPVVEPVHAASPLEPLMPRSPGLLEYKHGLKECNMQHLTDRRMLQDITSHYEIQLQKLKEMEAEIKSLHAQLEAQRSEFNARLYSAMQVLYHGASPCTTLSAPSTPYLAKRRLHLFR